MTIRYTTTRGDLLFANFRTLARNRFLLVFWSIAIAGVCYSAVNDPKVVDHAVGYKIGLCATMALLYFVLFFSVTLVVTSAMALLRKNTGVLGEHRVSISDEGLMESTVHNESLHRWSGYHRTVSTKGYLLLYITDAQFHIISKKRPLIEGDLTAFEAALNEKTKSA
jgi:hypothetical protein